MTQKRNFSTILWNLIVLALLAGGILLLGFFSLPFESAKGLADHLSRDQNFQSLTVERFTGLRLPLLAIGAAMLAGGAALMVLRRKTQAWTADGWQALANAFGNLWNDWRTMATGWQIKRLAKSRKVDLLVLLGLILVAAGIRVAFVNRPMSHDEAYTIVAFATRPLWVVLSDYSLPNNHVFHSLLVHFSALAFGIQPWAVRLPVVVAGVLVVPAGYLLACLHLRAGGRPTALLSAAMLACTPLMVNLSTDARGYILICLFTLLIISLGVYVQGHRNRAAWGLIVVFSALGFYTTPIMIYPFGVLLTWLALAAMAGETRPAYGTFLHFVKYLVSAAFTCGLLSALLYTPIFLTYGLKAVVANRFVLPLSLDDFLAILPERINETWSNWTGNPVGNPAIGFILMVGVVLSLLLHRRITTSRVPMQAAAVLWLAFILPVQRPYPWPKLWSWLLPLFLIWGSAGLLGLVKNIKVRGKYSLDTLFCAVIILAVVAASLLWTVRSFPAINATGEIEATTIFIKGQLQQGDIVVAADPDDAPLWYYFQLHQVPESVVTNNQHIPFRRAFVLVNPGYGQTLESVIDQRGPEVSQLDPGSASVVHQAGGTVTYRVLARAGK